MSPELERLLNALWEYRTGEPKNRARQKPGLERMIADTLARVPGVSREEFMAALEARYDEFLRSRRKPTSLPPQA